MTSSDTAQTAYFTLLRARDEFANLQRYAEYLDAERRRLRRFVAEGSALGDTVDARLRRPMRQIDAALADVVRDRLAWIDDEQARLPERETAAEAFVAECESAYARVVEST